MKRPNICCTIGCRKLAKWMIYPESDPFMDSKTYSCDEHKDSVTCPDDAVEPYFLYCTRKGRQMNDCLEHGCNEKEATISSLQDRVKELEESIKLYRGAIVESGDLKKENARLRKVVEAGSKYMTACELPSHCVTLAQTMEYRNLFRVALRELDGECVTCDLITVKCEKHEL